MSEAVLANELDDDTLVYGYVRTSSQETQISFIPNEIIKLIFSFYDTISIKFIVYNKYGKIDDNCDAFTLKINKDNTFITLLKYLSQKYKTEHDDIHLWIPLILYRKNNVYCLFTKMERKKL